MHGGRYDKAGKRSNNPSMDIGANNNVPLLGSEERKSRAEASTGAGGDASGGSAEGGGSLINLFSGTHRAFGSSVTPDKHLSRKWR